MVFNSLIFVVFFATILMLYRLLQNWTAKKTLVLLASYVFYGAWNPPFALLRRTLLTLEIISAHQHSAARFRSG